MLEAGIKNLPKKVQEIRRLEIPKVKGMVEGNKTIVNNFLQICDVLNRSKESLLKYLQRELATPAIIDENRLIFGRKLNSSLINDKIGQFSREFVICQECGKSDTEIIEQDKAQFLKCQACGSKKTIKALK